MDYTLTEEQAYKLLKPFFDLKFDGAKEGTEVFNGEQWAGLFVDDVMLIGHPVRDKYTWYSNGQIFYTGMLLFSMKSKDFNPLLKKYMDEVYPSLEVNKVW
jgi:hypothetical protein